MKKTIIGICVLCVIGIGAYMPDMPSDGSRPEIPEGDQRPDSSESDGWSREGENMPEFPSDGKFKSRTP